ncbi:MAG: hypothetical protein IRZ28_01500 [Steroidobacteraceae bacterium]|nr:hypothetical protein [Steroidobacteraceae bacterium]
MTAINIAIRGDRALIVTDTLVSGGVEPLYTVKCSAFPHLRLAVAGAGEHTLTRACKFLLMDALPAGTDAEDIAHELPAALRAQWARLRCTEPSMVFLVGIDRTEQAFAVAYTSAQDFAPQTLAPGCYLVPKPRVASPEGSATGPVQTAEPQTDEPQAPEPETAIPWRRYVRTVLEPIERQHRENPQSIGGKVQVTEVAPDCIHQWWLQDLAREAAA